MATEKFLTLTEMVQAAKRNLERNEWDYLVGGADTEASLRRNRAGVESWLFRPRVLNDVSGVSTQASMLGTDVRLPVLLCPIGSVQVFHPDGGVAVARAARDFGVMQMLSSVCLPDFEEVAERVPGPRIYQLYLVRDRAWMDEQIERAIVAGYTGFCLTADTQVYSRRERDILKRHIPGSGRQARDNDFGEQAKMTWDTVAHIKAKFDIPLVIKGVVRADDARQCVDAGVDVIYVSNHGGRQLDHTRACIDALPEVVEAVGGRRPVWVDGGFMRGADIVKALCLGAQAVGIGRLEGLAMAAGGYDALLNMLDILEHEVHTSMALLGVDSIQALKPDLVERGHALGPSHVLSAFPLLEEGY